MTVIELQEDPSNTPGALSEQKARRLVDGGLIEFELAPAGWLMPNGERRRWDWRAYHYTPAPVDCDCEGGRRFDRSARGRRCQDCNGTGVVAKRVRLPSVSSVLGAISPKPGLPPWAEARGIEGAIEAVNRGLIDPKDPESVKRAVEIVRANLLGADRARDTAADRGLNVHACLEHYMRTGSPPNPAHHPVEHWGYLRALSRWLVKVNPEPEGAQIEQLVAHPELGYAGRFDLRCQCDGMTVLWDGKTQERGGIYLGAHAQVGLYERAAQRCGDQPADLLKIVVFAANGEFREMAADHDLMFTDAALEWYREAKPVDSMCAQHNRAEIEARKTPTERTT